MLTTHRIERRDDLLLVIIVFIAAILRYGQAGIVEFFHDDAMLASLGSILALPIIAPLAVHSAGYRHTHRRAPIVRRHPAEC